MNDIKFIFGGTFDPPHLGHINALLHLSKLVNIKTVFLMPSKIQGHKAQATASQQHRLEMLKMVCSEYPIFELDTFELKLEQTSYTAKTLHAMQSLTPDTRIVFIMGTDSWMSLKSWYDVQSLAKHYHFVVIARPMRTEPKQELLEIAESLGINAFWLSPSAQDQVSLAQEAWSSSKASVSFCETPKLAISSTQIRSFFKHGKYLASEQDTKQACGNEQTIDEWLPRSVQSYIIKHGIYD